MTTCKQRKTARISTVSSLLLGSISKEEISKLEDSDVPPKKHFNSNDKKNQILQA